MARRTNVEVARDRNELAKLRLDTALRTKKLDRVQNGYDGVVPTSKRRQPKIERTNEDGILPQRKRLKAANIGRDLERNFSMARAILHQFRVNVVGPLGKIQINVDGGEQAAKWYNSKWSACPDFRNDDHWSTVLQNIVASVPREGDLLLVVDDGPIEDSGQLLMWEADQIAPLSDKAFKEAIAQYEFISEDATQDNGIVRDKWGREIGYVVSGKRGQTLIEDMKDATVYARGVARLVKNPWRMNQGRGTPSLLTSATQIEDLYEILVTELQAAKKAASVAGVVKRTNATTDWDDPGSAPEYLPENVGKSTAATDAEAANSTDPTARNYEALEAMSTYMEYMESGDEFELLDTPRPNVNLAPFIDAVMGMAGSSMGLAQVYTTLKASTSYTAFRGEMILSWMTFIMLQKWLERSVADWVAVKVLNWAQDKNHITALPDGWEGAISWVWPTMPSVDPLKEANATKINLKNGTTDYAALLGPEWEKRLTGFGTQLDRARELNLPLSVLETASGNQADSTDSTATGDDDDE